MVKPSYHLTLHGIGSTGEVTITIVEALGAKRAGINLDASSRYYAGRPAANEARRRVYPSLYAALAAAGDVIREEAWPCSIRIKLFDAGPEREALKDDALVRGRDVIKDWDAGRMVTGDHVAQVIADLIARVEDAETRASA